MATGDLIVFDEAKAKMIEGDWAATDNFYMGIVTNAVPPTAAFGGPQFSDFTEVTATAAYTAGGTDLGTLAAIVTELAGTVTVDSSNATTWAQHASGSVDASWAIVYNNTDANKDAWCFIELGTVDMSAGSLTVTINASGLFTIA